MVLDENVKNDVAVSFLLFVPLLVTIAFFLVRGVYLCALDFVTMAYSYVFGKGAISGDFDHEDRAHGKVLPEVPLRKRRGGRFFYDNSDARSDNFENIP